MQESRSRAVRLDSFGGPEVLDIREVPAPQAGPGQVRVRVTAAGLNLLSGLHVPPLVPVVSELMMTVLFYIPTTLVVAWLHHKLVGASRSDV